MGRSRQFNENDVLQKAMWSFWKNGYQKTTVRTLESDMGINQFSIYATFKNKQELYRRVLEIYQQRLDKEFLGGLQRESSTVAEIKDFMVRFSISIANNKIPNGCLMVNSVRELHHFDPKIKTIILAFFDTMKLHFIRALRNSQAQGMIQLRSSEDQVAEYLVGIAQSISIYSKIKTPRQIRAYINFALGVLSK